MTAVSSKSASLRPSSLYFQRRVPRSTSNPDLPSPSLSPEEELAFAANASLTAASKSSILLIISYPIHDRYILQQNHR